MIYWQDIVYFLLIFEAVLVAGFLITIPFHRIYLHYQKKNYESFKKEIGEMIVDQLMERKKGDILEKMKKYSGQEILLLTLEKFDRLIASSVWEEIKDGVTETCLLPKARRYATERSWIKRNFAARCFVLTPKKIDEDKINKLATDPNFLVSSVAAMAAMTLGNRETIHEIIRKMGREKGYARYFYRDLLSKQNNSIYKMIQDLAETDKDPDTHLACLELLTEKAIIRIPPYIENDMVSENRKIRLNATKIVARNPNERTISLLTEVLNDNDPEIRAEAIRGFLYFPSAEAFKKLEDLMNDTYFLVRMTAAQTLWKMGKKGRALLEKQEKNDAAKNILLQHGGSACLTH